MKAIDIALKDLTRSFRSLTALVFMFGIPIGVTALFYFAFGAGSRGGEFSLPRISVAVANLDTNAPRLHVERNSLPEGIDARTMSELVVSILASEEMSNLLEVAEYPSAEAARAAVDTQLAQVAIVIPDGFARRFYEPYGQSEIELYQDPTLTIGPGIVKSILNQFMDSLSGLKISTDLVVDELTAESRDSQEATLIGPVIAQLLEESQARSRDPVEAYLENRTPRSNQAASGSLNTIIGPILCGMMVFYAFYTGTASAESILREEEEGTMPRLFTTPTPQATILSGKFLAVLLTVGMQLVIMLLAGRLIFQIEWGQLNSLVWVAAGIIASASAFGIFVNSWLKDTRQGGVVFGGVLTFSGMLGMVRIFGMSNPASSDLTEAISLLVPQGWAIRGILQTMGGDPLLSVIWTTVVLAAWSALFFVVGVWRFRNRYK